MTDLTDPTPVPSGGGADVRTVIVTEAVLPVDDGWAAV